MKSDLQCFTQPGQYDHLHQTRRQVSGFTLIEVLVALAIFAVLALAGWKVFDALIKVRDRNQIHTQRLSALQSSYTLMLRDFSQLVARPARQSASTEPALIIADNKITFTRMGAFDPTMRSNSSLERVTYQYDAGQQRLIRTSYRNPDQVRPQTPPSSVLLSDITNFSMQALEPAPADFWPPGNNLVDTDNNGKAPEGDSRLPQGVQIQFTINDRPIVWRFSLVKKLPEPVASSTDMSKEKDNQENQQEDSSIKNGITTTNN